MKVATLVVLTSSLMLAGGVALADTTADGSQTTAVTQTAPADAPANATANANQHEKGAMTAAQNLKVGEAFLATNKGKAGVVTLPDGLQYKIIQPGKGVKPNPTDVVTVNYEGKLIDGKVFDSSYHRGKAVTFPVSGVIEGWQQALQLMKAGATWELYIPAKLAYGAQGAPGVIGPNETLIFKVHLITVKKQSA